MTSFRCLVLGPERFEEASLIELKVVSLNFAGCKQNSVWRLGLWISAVFFVLKWKSSFLQKFCMKNNHMTLYEILNFWKIISEIKVNLFGQNRLLVIVMTKKWDCICITDKAGKIPVLRWQNKCFSKTGPCYET